jgi:hypothetical protein
MGPELFFDKYYSKEAKYLPNLIGRIQKKIDADTSTSKNIEKQNLAFLQYYKDSLYEKLGNADLSVTDASKYNDVARFYQALSFIELKEYVKAENILARYCATQFFELNAEACWYYGLVLMQDHKKWSGAVLVFRRLSQSVVSSHAADAKRMLDILEKALKEN